MASPSGVRWKSVLWVIWYLLILFLIFLVHDFPGREFRYWRL